VAGDLAKNWTTPMDLLVLDGDQSRPGPREAYDSRQLVTISKAGGIIAIHNSNDRIYAHDHAGHGRLVVPPDHTDIRLVATTTTSATPEPF
jgi:hypothetical protein